MERIAKATSKEKYRLLEKVSKQEKNIISITRLCDIANVSRSGYYKWLKNRDKRNTKEEQDQVDFEKILEAYQFRGYDKGRRGIYMRLLHMGIVMNQKKVQRLMRKYNLFCPIRKANPYRRMQKALKTDQISKNLVNREFREHGPGKILLTDITYLIYGNGQKAYLSTIKDAFTMQILAYVISESLEVDFVLETIELLIKKHQNNIQPDAIIHSDQGVHYTSLPFRKLLKDKELRQSMSRRGNCWDNAPQESFFGHMKDEVNIKESHNIQDIKKMITNYIDYYNNDRYQWQLAKLSPNEYAEYVRTGIYPLMNLVSEPENDQQRK